MDEKLLGHQFLGYAPKQTSFLHTGDKKKPQKSLYILLIFINYIISALQNVILHQIWSIDKDSMAI